MRIIQGVVFGTLVTGITLGSSWLSSCDDRPSNPVPPEEPKEYSFYFLDAHSAQCFEYSPTRGLVDSFVMPFPGSYEIRSATLSADGRTMYVATQLASYALNLFSGDTTRILDTPRRVLASPDGRFLVVLGNPFEVRRSKDFSPLFTDTVGLTDGVYSNDCQTFYGCGQAGFVYELHLDSPFSPRVTWFQYRAPTVLRISRDELKWYLYSVDLQRECTYRFEVYDTELDSTVFSTRVVPGLGDLAVSPDGRFVYFTNPGYGVMPNPDCPEPPKEITIYDASKNQLYLKISTAATYGRAGFLYLDIRTLESTPDEKWILGVSVNTGFVLIDADAAQVAKFEAVGDSIFDHYLFSPMAQAGM